MKICQGFARNRWLRLGCSITLAFALALVLLLMPVTAGKVVRLPIPDLAQSGLPSPPKRPWPPGGGINLSLPFGVELVRATGGLTITKSVSSPTVDQGGLLTYTLRITNGTDIPITDIAVTDTVPPDTDCQAIYDSSDGRWIGVESSCDTREVKWIFAEFVSGVFANGSSVELVYTVVVTEPLPDQSQIVNPAFSYGVKAISPTTYVDSGAVGVTTTVNAPEWQISKSVAPDSSVEPGDLLTYTISVLNDGHLDTDGLYTITDVIPQYTSYVTSTPPAAQDGNVLTWLFNQPLAMGASRVVTFVVQVDDHPLADGLSIVNDTYSVTGANVYTGATGSPVAVTVQAPDLHITKSDYVDPIWAGGTLTYTLAYSNSGGADAVGVIISDTIDGITEFVGSTPISDSNVGDTYYWNIGPLTAGNSGSIVITVSVPSPLPNGTLLTNTAGISSPMGYKDQAIQTTTVSGSPVLHLLKEASAEIVEPGELITYSISYSNSGNAPAFGVRITDTIDGNTSFVGSDPPSDGGSYYWDISELWPSDTHQITLTVRVTDSLTNATILTNQAIIRDSGGVSDTSQVTLSVQSAPILHVVKTADTEIIEPGDTLTYSLWYSNTGNAPATGVVITDDLPAQLHFLSAEPSPSSGGDQQQVWTMASVNVGGPYSITLVVTSSNVIADMTDLPNQVTMSSVETATVMAEETVTVHAVELSVDKAAAADLVKANEFITYTITVTNSGHAIADQVRITDTLPVSIVQASVVSSASPGVVFESTTPPEYVWTAPTLDALSQLTVTISGRLITSPWTASGQVFSNTVQVGSENPEFNLANNSDQEPATGRPGDPYTITLTAATTETVVGDTVVVTATVSDPWGNPAYDAETVFFDSSLGVTLPAFANPENGVATTTLSSLQAGEAIVTGTVGGIDATTSVAFLAGALDHFAVSVTSPQTAGITFSTVITALDQYGNLVDFDGTVSLTDTTETLVPTGSPSMINGQGAISVTIYTATPADVITATWGITPIIGVSGPFLVLPGEPGKLTITVEPTTIRVCQTAAVTTAISDQWGNTVPNQTVSLLVIPGPSPNGAANLSPDGGNTGPAGIFASTLQGAGAGNARIYGQSGSLENLTSMPVVSISGPPMPTSLSLSVAPDPLYTGGATAVVTATVDDCLVDPPTGQVVTFTVSNPSLAWFPGPSDTVVATTNASGIATATLTSNSTPVAGTLTITGTVEGQVDVTSLDIALAPTTSLTITKTASPPGGDVEPGQSLNYTLVARNIGGAEASHVLISDTLPPGAGLVSIINSSGTVSSTSPINVFANTLATGDALTVTIEVTVTSQVSGTLLNNQASVDSAETEPAFSQIASHQVVTSTAGKVFLPIILRNWDGTTPPTPTKANLVITDIGFWDKDGNAPTTPPGIGQNYHVYVVVSNVGTDPVPHDFWVDLYLNPVVAPTVNQPWQLLSQSGENGVANCPTDTDSCFGRAWLVTTDLTPGQVITLNTAMATDVRFDRWPAEEGVPYYNRHKPITALVDSWNDNSMWFGNVYESDETDNLPQSVISSMGSEEVRSGSLPSSSLPLRGVRPPLPASQE
ncbi:MAG: DUF11 domain-containing protein [Anaerolineales bacterium]|nr:MAG: DUF11 domain-containing protein [Anaerolineales bacterium]